VNAKNISMPGTKAKCAEALRRNVAYLVQEFGVERIGFLTLTVGDWHKERFVGICEREEAEKRFHRAMRGIAARYQCGVTVTERCESRALHWHLVVVVGADIRTGCNFEAFERRDYRSAPERLRLEWLWWRTNAPKFGLGRHELLPVKVNSDAIGNYVGKYIGKGWNQRTEGDKGARTVRYFGLSWKKTGVKSKPPFGIRFCACTARAGAWREAMRQVQLLTKLHGVELTYESIKQWHGSRWAWRVTQKLRLLQFFTHGKRLHPLFRDGLDKHNAEAGDLHHIGNTNLDHWLPSPEKQTTYREELQWKRTMNSLDRDGWDYEFPVEQSSTGQANGA
jgi:hypothetical protein